MNTSTQVEELIYHFPKLHLWGYGTPRRGSFDKDFDAAREELMHPSMLYKIQTAANWASRHLVATKPNPKRDRSTYHWKHRYEAHTTHYLPSGAFAVAAVLAGLPISFDGFNPTIHARESRHNPIAPRVLPKNARA